MPAVPFVFGKLPTHGDFVARGLDPDARAAWDEWASDGLQRAQAALGPAYEAAYAAAPPWRFAFGPGVFGPGWRAGALACSVDRAGRRFPVVAGLAWTGEPEGDVEAVGEAAEAVVYEALAESDTADALLARLAAMDAVAATAPGRARFWTLGGERHAPMSLEAAAPPPDLLTRMIAPSMTEAGR